MRAILYFFGLILCLNSCISSKDISYLEPSKELKLNSLGYIDANKEEYKLQVDDVLALNIISKDPDVIKLFGNQNVGAISGIDDGSFYISGLHVASDGTVDVPNIGKVSVLNMGIEKARQAIERKLHAIYRDDAVFVRLHFKGINYSMLGEVNRIGNFVIGRTQYNLYEALANSGDMTITADRKKVKLIRQYPEGKKIIELDLTKEDIMNSEYFYIQPNDIFIFNPTKHKTWGVGTNAIGTFGTIASIILTSFSLFFAFRSIK